MKQQFLAPVARAARIAAAGLLVCFAIPAVAQPQWGEPVQITKGTEVSTVQFLQNGMLLIAAGDSVHSTLTAPVCAKIDGRAQRANLTRWSDSGV